MSENDIIRFQTMIESLREQFVRHEKTVADMLAEQNLILRDMSGQNVRFDGAITSLETLRTEQEKIKEAVSDMSRRLDNAQVTIGTIKWIAGSLFVAVLPVLGAAVLYYIRAIPA